MSYKLIHAVESSRDDNAISENKPVSHGGESRFPRFSCPHVFFSFFLKKKYKYKSQQFNHD